MALQTMESINAKLAAVGGNTVNRNEGFRHEVNPSMPLSPNIGQPNPQGQVEQGFGGNYWQNMARIYGLEETEKGKLLDEARSLMESAGGSKQLPFYKAIQQTIDKYGYTDSPFDMANLPQPVAQPPTFKPGLGQPPGGFGIPPGTPFKWQGGFGDNYKSGTGVTPSQNISQSPVSPQATPTQTAWQSDFSNIFGRGSQPNFTSNIMPDWGGNPYLQAWKNPYKPKEVK